MVSRLLLSALNQESPSPSNSESLATRARPALKLYSGISVSRMALFDSQLVGLGLPNPSDNVQILQIYILC